MTDHVLHPAAFAPGAASPFGRLAARLCRWITVQHTRRALGQLPDDLLRDIGLTRGDIMFLADALADGSADARSA